MIFLDTCALLWWTLEPEKLSPKAATACTRIRETGAFVSSISIWEIGIKRKKGKLDLGMSLEDYLSRLKSLNTLTFLPVNEETWLLNLSLDWDHPDPVDRTIVAEARKRHLSLVTKDEEIRKFYKPCIW
jgi:PIN domain nuclease of toxin-antitoxin system